MSWFIRDKCQEILHDKCQVFIHDKCQARLPMAAASWQRDAKESGEADEQIFKFVRQDKRNYPRI